MIASNQPIYYRLNRISNAIHIDPKQAKKFKLKQPILHGQAIIDYSIKIILQALHYNNKNSKLKSYHAKILGTAYPGFF